jgi:hypothetical protein
MAVVKELIPEAYHFMRVIKIKHGALSVFIGGLLHLT